MPSSQDIQQRLSTLSTAKKALLLRRLLGLSQKGATTQSITRCPAGTPATPSFAQQRLWFIDQLEKDGSVYNIPQAWHLNGFLDPVVLEKSIRTILSRHKVLRSSFPSDQGTPEEAISTDEDFRMSIIDLRSFPASERTNKTLVLMSEEAAKPFDLCKGPLVRATLLHTGENRYSFLFVMHHIVSDGWSFGIFRKELGTLYDAYMAGKNPELPPLDIQYTDYAYWQQRWMMGERLQIQLAYWKKRLEGARPLLQLPTDRPRPSVQSYRGANVYFSLSRKLSDDLHGLCRSEGVSLFMVLLAAYNVLLHRLTSTEDILVGIPIANRAQLELESLIGLFVNTLVLRTDLSGNPSFKELLQRVREVALQAYANQDLPFEKLVEEIQPQRDLSFNPLFQVMFVLRNTPARPLALAGLKMEPLEVEIGASMFDLTLYMTDETDGLTGWFEYTTDLFSRSTMERMVGRLSTLLEGVTHDPNARISDIPIVPADERDRILRSCNETHVEYPRGLCVHDLIAAQVKAAPHSIAAVCGKESVSYDALNASANRIAHRLRALGAGPDVLVGVCVERSLDMLAAVLGVMKSGGAYVPLDPGFPSQRLSLILEDSGAGLLITQRHLHGLIPSYAGKSLYLEDPSIAMESAEEPHSRAGQANIAYVMFTSGSTGRPKGVQIEHGALVNVLRSMGCEPGMSSDDILLAVTTLSFDIAGLELFLPLMKGGQVVIARPEVTTDGRLLGELIAACGATVMQATPATWRILLESGWSGRKTMKILCGGEALTPELARELAPLCASLWNVYGPTETTIWSTVWKVDLSRSTISIGKPIANTKTYVLDSRHALLPLGVAGELFISGDGVARGYLNRPELNVEKFLQDPFTPGMRMYRTGDLCRLMEDGCLEHLGRLDHQVKIRGYRIELGDVEAALADHPDVAEAAAVVEETTAGNARLTAFYVKSCGSTLQPEKLRQFLKQTLPEYMIPSRLVEVEKIPLTPNGKVDRLALSRERSSEEETDKEGVAPRDALELQIAGMWAKTLGLKSIGVRDDFFALGGHSLLAARLFARMEKVLGKRIPLASIFRASTVEQFTAMLREKDWAPAWESLVAIRPGGSRPPLFLCHGAEGNVLLYRDLALRLSQDQPVYGLQSQGLDGKGGFQGRIEEMASLYAREIRALQPEGPYHIGGYCMGGAIALEIAQILQSQGQEVSLLALIETYNIQAGVHSLPIFYSLLHHFQTLKFHLDNLLLLRRKDALTFFRQKAKVQASRARAAVMIWLHGRLPQLFGSSRTYPHIPLRKVNDRAFDEYHPRAYAGRIVLFRPRKNYLGLDDPAFGWGDIASEGVDVHRLPVSPHGMLVEPFAALVADGMKSYLEKSTSPALAAEAEQLSSVSR